MNQPLKPIGLIDNLQDIQNFVENKFANASAADVMAATGGNTGNLAFVYGARQIIANPIIRIGWGWTPAVVRERVSRVVVCCANQLGAHTDLGAWAERLEAFGVPVTLLGLGAQSKDLNTAPEIPPGTLRFLDVVKHSAWGDVSNIAVRGEFTSDVLHGRGFDSLPLGCPSLYISPHRKLGAHLFSRQSATGIKKVAVAAGNPWDGKSAGIEPLLVELVERYSGDYVLQHPESMLQFAFGERESITTQAKARFLEVYGSRFEFESLLEWYRRSALVFADVSNWMRYLQRTDFAIGPRYHGIALALQAGVPGSVITIDGRTQELCRSSGIKSLDVEKAMTMEPADLIAAAQWTRDDAELFDQNREIRAAGYVEFLRKNGLQPSAQLITLSGSDT